MAVVCVSNERRIELLAHAARVALPSLPLPASRAVSGNTQQKTSTPHRQTSTEAHSIGASTNLLPACRLLPRQARLSSPSLPAPPPLAGVHALSGFKSLARAQSGARQQQLASCPTTTGVQLPSGSLARLPDGSAREGGGSVRATAAHYEAVRSGRRPPVVVAVRLRRVSSCGV